MIDENLYLEMLRAENQAFRDELRKSRKEREKAIREIEKIAKILQNSLIDFDIAIWEMIKMKAIIELDDKKFKKLKRILENDADRDLSDIEALKELFFIEYSRYNLILDYREYAKIEMIKEWMKLKEI